MLRHKFQRQANNIRRWLKPVLCLQTCLIVSFAQHLATPKGDDIRRLEKTGVCTPETPTQNTSNCDANQALRVDAANFSESSL